MKLFILIMLVEAFNFQDVSQYWFLLGCFISWSKYEIDLSNINYYWTLTLPHLTKIDLFIWYHGSYKGSKFWFLKYWWIDLCTLIIWGWDVYLAMLRYLVNHFYLLNFLSSISSFPQSCSLFLIFWLLCNRL